MDPLNKKVPAFDIERRSEEQKVLVVSSQEFAEHGKLVDASLVDTQDGERSWRSLTESGAGCEFLP